MPDKMRDPKIPAINKPTTAISNSIAAQAILKINKREIAGAVLIY